MYSDHRVAYWLKGLKIQNFGDLLSEWLYHELTKPNQFWLGRKQPIRDYDTIHLIGSVISDYHIRTDLEHSRGISFGQVTFWGCGARDDRKLTPELLDHCDFRGVRGPLTRDLLGLPLNTAIGDPALLLPVLYKQQQEKTFIGQTVCVPHFLERKGDAELRLLCGADRILRPNISPSLTALKSFLDCLGSASFVLCGALHAAIVCCAYGIPFCYFDSGFIDCPFKWQDFSASVGIEGRFAKTVAEGQALYISGIQGCVRLPDINAILAAAPYVPPRSLQRRVQRYVNLAL